jgi:flagellar operon protein
MVDKVQPIAEPRAPTPRQPAAPSRTTTSSPGFDAVLREKIGDSPAVKFSAHALRRLDSRKIQITPAEKNVIERGVQKAAEKGARESLLLTDRFALVVSVRNRTVITVAHNDELDDGVFTNIDSAVICGRSDSMIVRQLGDETGSQEES